MAAQKKEPRAVDEYLAALPAGQRAALKKLRTIIRGIVPEAEECLSYRLPTFRLDGRMLVSYGAAARHCAFYPLSASTVKDLADDLEGYDTSKGTIRFPADRPLPVSLVRKLVRARIAENAAAREKKRPAAARAASRRR